MLLVRTKYRRKKQLQVMQWKPFYFQKYYWLEVLVIIHSWIIISIVPELQYLPLFDKNRDIKAQGIILMNPMALFAELFYCICSC